jgi:hypothetical protein
MKRILIAALCVIGFVKANAQTERGNFLVGGNMSLGRTETQSNNPIIQGGKPQGSLTISPNIGYFVVNNLMFEIQPSYSHTWYLNHDSKSNSFAIGPVVRYYFRFGKFAVFPEVAASYNEYKSKYLTFDGDTGLLVPASLKGKGTTYRAGIGATYFVSTNIGIEGILAYSESHPKDETLIRSSDLYLKFGIQFYFTRKQ